jgi:hypothetical protein
MEWLWMSAASFFSLLVPIFIVVALVYLVARSRPGQQNGITAHQALVSYFYFVITASVITMLVGLAYFIRVGIGQAYDDGEIASDLVLASILLGIGLILCMLHDYGRLVVERRMEKPTATPRRVYLFTMLFISSVAGLISVPLSIYRAIEYYYLETSYYAQAPQIELNVVAVVVPVWVYYMFRVVRDIRQKNKGEIES